MIRELLALEVADTTYNIVYLILYTNQIAVEFNEMNKNNLLQCLWYYFYDPQKMLEIYEHILENPLSTRQVKEYIENCAAKGKSEHKGYN